MIDRLLPAAASAHAASLDEVLKAVHLHIAVQAIAWGAFFVFCLISFRRRAGHAASYQGLRPTLPVLAIALVIVGDAALLATSALPVWFSRSAPPPAMPEPIEVRVFAEQFAWNIQYPGPDRTFGRTSPALISASNPLGIDRTDPAARDDVGLINSLMLPVGHPVIVQSDRTRRHPLVHAERDAGQAGRGAGTGRPHVVHADASPANGRSRARSSAGSVTTACAAITRSWPRTNGTGGWRRRWRLDHTQERDGFAFFSR